MPRPTRALLSSVSARLRVSARVPARPGEPDRGFAPRPYLCCIPDVQPVGPPSVRAVDAVLATAAGVMRDTVGALHNLLHLLGSVRVGPRAIASVVPDVHASCAPMVAAIRELPGSTHALISDPAVAELSGMVAERMGQLSQQLGERRSAAQPKASERLRLESSVAAAARDLDGALALLELLLESSSRGSVPVDVSDVLRESFARGDGASGKARRVRVRVVPPPDGALIQVNPRLAVRLLTFAAALLAPREGSVTVTATAEAGRCHLRLEKSPAEAGTMTVAVPPVIAPAEPLVTRVAELVGAAFQVLPGGAVQVTFPLSTGG